MTSSKSPADKAVPVVRAGKPLSLETVNRIIARVRRARDRDNLGNYGGGALKIAHPAKVRGGTARKPPKSD
jgi:hypothetical protein